MANTGTLDTINRYFDTLKVSPGTVNLNALHAMCLMPLLNDLFGGKMKDYAVKDKSFWLKFMEKCFPNLHFGTESSCANTVLYVGTFDTAPTSSTIILSNSETYDLSNNTKIISPRVTGTYFWVAVPSGYSLSRVENLNFAGDFIPASGFTRENTTIKNGQYSLYWLKSRIPFKSTYQIILK